MHSHRMMRFASRFEIQNCYFSLFTYCLICIWKEILKFRNKFYANQLEIFHVEIIRTRKNTRNSLPVLASANPDDALLQIFARSYTSKAKTMSISSFEMAKQST